MLIILTLQYSKILSSKERKSNQKLVYEPVGAERYFVFVGLERDSPFSFSFPSTSFPTRNLLDPLPFPGPPPSLLGGSKNRYYAITSIDVRRRRSIIIRNVTTTSKSHSRKENFCYTYKSSEVATYPFVEQKGENMRRK